MAIAQKWLADRYNRPGFTFGASAPLKALQKKFGFEGERVAAAARELLGKQ